MKILLFGKDGQVGWELQRSLALLGEVVALGRDGGDRPCGDLTDLEGISATVLTLRPDIVVNAAAYTAVDQAEHEPDLAWLVNASAPGVLACAARQVGALLVHYSTDYVFDGSGTTPWVETDQPGPLNVYGRTKLEGERLIVRQCDRHLILRTGWVYAARGRNFVRTILRLAAERERLTVIDDQFGTPTGADLIADATAHAIRHLQHHPGDAGIYHFAATGATSWHEYAGHVIDVARRIRPSCPLAVKEVVPVSTADFPTEADRPLNSRLDTARLVNVFGLELPPWHAGVERMLTEILG